ncbi:hypothetical protein HHK36_019250 [Tetracentron sinense]|uniref:Cyclin-dependent kinases regulatory subunit n=1 Tax=Tetracentron sinense TaxID=13715 RepID=A0A834YVX7_TETSI|nr:hypothetical protein HHK36_019250 [Tetracentron sinense]
MQINRKKEHNSLLIFLVSSPLQDSSQGQRDGRPDSVFREVLRRHFRIQVLEIPNLRNALLTLALKEVEYLISFYLYRHVVLPPEVAKLLPKNRLLSENEWRAIGVQQSRGWVHYAIHRPEPHIMLFRRPLNYQQQQQQQQQENKDQHHILAK